METQDCDKADAENFLDVNEQIRSRDVMIEDLRRTNTILKANISTLFRTARAEMLRKNERIAELQSELDNLIFRRNNNPKQSTSHQEDRGSQ